MPGAVRIRAMNQPTEQVYRSLKRMDPVMTMITGMHQPTTPGTLTILNLQLHLPKHGVQWPCNRHHDGPFA